MVSFKEKFIEDHHKKGYVGMSYSCRAEKAYENHEMPKSNWTKAKILDVVREDEKIQEYILQETGQNLDMGKMKQVNHQTLKDCLVITSRHHTSAAANLTDFYSVDYAQVAALVKAGYCSHETDKTDIKKVDDEPGYCHGSYRDTEYHPFRHKGRRYKETWVNFTNGRIRGEWLILEDGKRKMLRNVKISSRTSDKI